jgi:Domain of unknown function (DUF4349)
MPFDAGAKQGRGVASDEDSRMIRTILLTALTATTLAACSENPPGKLAAAGRVSVSGGYSSSDRFGPAAPSQEFRLAQLANAQSQPQAGPTRHIAVGDGRVNARASLRIAPERYPALAAVITARPVEVTEQSERADDRTIAVLDVDRRLAVKTALRDRLTAMLNDPATNSVADLIAIEKELVQAQGDIEAATTLRNYLRTITDTVQVDITYDGQQVVVAGYDFSPIKRAVDSISATFAASVASLITFVAATVPWLPVIVLVLWGARRGLRRWRTRGT